MFQSAELVVFRRRAHRGALAAEVRKQHFRLNLRQARTALSGCLTLLARLDGEDALALLPEASPLVTSAASGRLWQRSSHPHIVEQLLALRPQK